MNMSHIIKSHIYLRLIRKGPLKLIQVVKNVLLTATVNKPIKSL